MEECIWLGKCGHFDVTGVGRIACAQWMLHIAVKVGDHRKLRDQTSIIVEERR